MFTKEYIKEYGDKVFIAILENGKEVGYYAGAIYPYTSTPYRAKLYANKKTARSIMLKQGINTYKLENISNILTI